MILVNDNNPRLSFAVHRKSKTSKLRTHGLLKSMVNAKVNGATVNVCFEVILLANSFTSCIESEPRTI